MHSPPPATESNRRALAFTAAAAAAWVALTLAAPLLAPVASDVAIELNGAWSVSPPETP